MSDEPNTEQSVDPFAIQPWWDSTTTAPRLLKATMVDAGIVIQHNMPCAVCGERHAIFILNDGYFQPCRKCQESGWQIIRPRTWFQRIVARIAERGR